MLQAPAQRILVVEDQAIVAFDIQVQLESLGYEVVGIAASAADAYRQARQALPDLVLMDIQLPGQEDGIDAGQRIRLELGLPIVFLTAYADAATLERAKSVQPYGYIVKPFDDRDLHTTIQIAMHNGQADRRRAGVQDQLLAVLNAQRHGTVMIDDAGRLTFLNRTAQTMLERTEEESLGRPWQEALGLAEERTRPFAEMLARPWEQRKRIAVVLEPRPGRLRPFEIEIQDDPRSPQSRVLLVHEATAIRSVGAQSSGPSTIVGNSPAIAEVFQWISDFAQVDTTVLINGETGTGKELVARAIHDRSRRSHRPFVALNCAGLSEELALSQLFGHRRGAFTGANEDQVGLFEAAHQGTLFLDEIGELSLRVQTTLLRVLEERRVMRVGDSQSRPVDVRIITATNRNLADEIAAGRFRADLLYRIRVARIHLPPLRERRADVPLLARAFLLEYSAALAKTVTDFDESALAVLQEHPWPGNIRELRNAVEYAVVRSSGSIIGINDLPPELLDDLALLPLAADLSDQDRENILEALARAGGNRKEAAQLLGISRATFYRRLTQFGIETPLVEKPSSLPQG